MCFKRYAASDFGLCQIFYYRNTAGKPVVHMADIHFIRCGAAADRQLCGFRQCRPQSDHSCHCLCYDKYVNRNR